jgi:leucyl-tRNA synthetase
LYLRNFSAIIDESSQALKVICMQKDIKYDHKLVEKKWQDVWEKSGMYYPDLKIGRKSFYNLWMFPYPSAEGLHAGHAFASTGSDIYGRYMRMKGRSVFQPIGYDSFGIHSENYALKINEDPKKVVERTTDNYEKQMRSLGHGYDWTRTVTTSNLDYYRWTEWLFGILFKAGLAYRKKQKVNFCPSCKTVLADEQVMTPKQAGKEAKDVNGNVVNGEDLRVCERCGTVVEDRNLEQWLFRITDYAERLLVGLEKIDWSERVMLSQKDWIGKSKGLTIKLGVKKSGQKINVWTKFWETVYGITFVVVSPEYAKEKLMDLVPDNYRKSVSEYIEISLKKSDKDRSEIKEKSGVDMGIAAVNPVNGREVPVFVADYVLSNVGTGAVMGVPAHDERDFAFAKKYDLEIIQVVSYADNDINTKVANQKMAYEGEGKLTNSGDFNGLDAWGKGKHKMAEWMIKEGFGLWQTNYHLRDWLISRQRYWGCPIPMIYCEKCAEDGKSYFNDSKFLQHPVNSSKRLLHSDQSDWDSAGWFPENNLPVRLPEIKDWQPEGTGKGPLANHPEYYEANCPNCGAKAKRETDVADTFLDSSWYFLAYPNVGTKEWEKGPANASGQDFFNENITKDWLPVDLYFGGAEHSVLHLMYARFINMVLYDLKMLDHEEPFPKFFAHGLMIKDGAKMSKSRGNVVNPDQYVKKFGADALRMYLVFMGPMDGYPDFRDTGIEGMGRFISKLWKVFGKIDKNTKEDKDITVKMHQTIKNVSKDMEDFSYNTAIAKIMEYVNLINEKENYNPLYLDMLVKLIAPFAPHIAEEVWYQIMGNSDSIHLSGWPLYDEKLTKERTHTISIQVNGKLRGLIEVDADLAKDKGEVIKLAKKDEKIAKWLEGKEIVKEIFIPGKIVNFVVN